MNESGRYKAEWKDEKVLVITDKGMTVWASEVTPAAKNLIEVFGVEIPEHNPHILPQTTIHCWEVVQSVDEYHGNPIGLFWHKKDADKYAAAHPGWYGSPSIVSKKVITILGVK